MQDERRAAGRAHARRGERRALVELDDLLDISEQVVAGARRPDRRPDCDSRPAGEQSTVRQPLASDARIDAQHDRTQRRTSPLVKCQPATRQWTSSASPQARNNVSTSKPGARAALRIGASLRVTTSIGAGQVGEEGGVDHHGPVAVGVDEVAGMDAQAEHGHGGVEGGDVDEGVARAHRAGEDREARVDGAEVAHGAVRQAAGDAEPLVDRDVDLAPERAEARMPVLRPRSPRWWGAGRRRHRRSSRAGGRARSRAARRPAPSRAGSPCGRSRRSAAAPGSRRSPGERVKPSAVRWPMTISSALQIVGVSTAFRAASVSGSSLSMPVRRSRPAPLSRVEQMQALTVAGDADARPDLRPPAPLGAGLAAAGRGRAAPGTRRRRRRANGRSPRQRCPSAW